MQYNADTYSSLFLLFANSLLKAKSLCLGIGRNRQKTVEVRLGKIETASALHAAYAPSFGEPWGEPQVGLKVYYFTLGGETVNAIETCQRYVGLLERAVEDFSKA